MEALLCAIEVYADCEETKNVARTLFDILNEERAHFNDRFGELGILFYPETWSVK